MKVKSIIQAVRWNLKKTFIFITNINELFWKPQRKIRPGTIINAFPNKHKIYFIQIGANDGISGDTLGKYITQYHWQGILVEPVPYLFKRLIDNYKDYKGLIFENSAVGLSDGFEKFYSMAEFDLQGKKMFNDQEKYQYDQLGSFDKSTLMKHAYMHPHFESLIEEIMVPSITYKSLLAKHNITKLDLLQLDTEGYDFEIISAINFGKVIPSIIIFEHLHMKKYEYKSVLKKLKKIGYKFYLDKWDTVGIMNKDIKRAE